MRSNEYLNNIAHCAAMFLLCNTENKVLEDAVKKYFKITRKRSSQLKFRLHTSPMHCPQLLRTLHGRETFNNTDGPLNCIPGHTKI
jgi:hypothetical protein